MRLFRKIARVFLSAVLFVLFLLTVFSVFCRYRLLNVPYYDTYVNGSYMQSLKSDLNGALQAECLYTGVPVETAQKAIDGGQLQKLALQSVKGIIEKVLYNRQYVPVSYPESYFRPVIHEFLNQYAAENHVDFNQATEDELVAGYTQIVSANANVLSQSLIDAVPDVSKYIGVCSAMSDLMPILLAFCALDVVLLLWLSKRRILNVVFYIFIPVWLGSSAIFITAAFAKAYRIQDKIVLGASKVKTLLSLIGADFINFIFILSLMCLIAASAALIAGFIAKLALGVKEKDL